MAHDGDSRPIRRLRWGQIASGLSLSPFSTPNHNHAILNKSCGDPYIEGLRHHPRLYARGDQPGTREVSSESHRIVYIVEPDTGRNADAGDVTVLHVFGPVVRYFPICINTRMKMIEVSPSVSAGRPARLVKFACFAGMLLMAACTQKAPPYTFSPAQVQILKENGSDSVRLGVFIPGENATGVTGITLRASSLASPYGDYPSYLKEALRQEFDEAGRLAPNAAIEISGVMTRNNLDTGLAVTGEGELEARIIVKRGEATLYNKSLLAKTTWDSSFVGAIAIPRAMSEYPRLVSEFISVLLRDSEFLAAIK